jgi:hypothetical protein
MQFFHFADKKSGFREAVPHSTDEHGMISNHNSKEEERQKKRKLKLAIIGIICAFAAIIVVRFFATVVLGFLQRSS